MFLCYLLVVCAAGVCLYAMRGFLFPIFVGSNFLDAQNFVGWLILGQVFVAIYRFWIKAIFFSGITFWVSVVSFGWIIGRPLPFALIPYGKKGCHLGPF